MELLDGICTACKRPYRVRASSAACPHCGASLEPAASARARPEAARPAGTRAGKSATRTRPASAGSRTGRVPQRAAKKSALPLVIAAALVLALGAWLFTSRGAEPAVAAEAPVVPEGVDLSRLPDLPPLEGTTDAEWAAMNERMTRYVEPPFGPASVQAGDRLMIQGHRSVPAILNGFKRLDLTTKDGAEIGWKVQTLLLQGLCGDVNFGWHRDARPEDVAFNQRVIARWFAAWEEAGDDDAKWAEIAKRDDPPAVPAGAAPASDRSE
jgi:hypothetical protein